MSLSALHDHTHSAWDTDRARRFADLGIVELSRYNEPEARRYRVADLVPADATTSLYADGGSGKSLLAVHLASHVALGQPWLGLEVGQSPVLYVDAELEVVDTTIWHAKAARKDYTLSLIHISEPTRPY